ncbi:hypothetical protein KFL_015970025, partial [Klebsormidium nitens]
MLAGSTQASKVVDYAIGQIVGKKQFAKQHDGISLRTLRSHAKQTECALDAMPGILEQVVQEVSVEKEKFLKVAEQAARRALEAQDQGRGVPAEVLRTAAAVAQRKEEIREAGSKAWRALVRRRFKKRLENTPELRHVARGHQVAIHVKYPHFKSGVEQLVMHMNGGRADAKRASVSIYMGKSTWKVVVKKLADEAAMGDLGGAIRVSESTLKKHRKRAERSCQPKIVNPAGQLDLSSRKVAKILLP